MRILSINKEFCNAFSNSILIKIRSINEIKLLLRTIRVLKYIKLIFDGHLFLLDVHW